MATEQIFEYYSDFDNCFEHEDDIFEKFNHSTHNKDDWRKRFIFIPPRDIENPSILFVCHIDTVQSAVINSETDNFYYGAGFDDRTGLYLCSQIFLSKYKTENICFLITDHEESAASTAQFSHDVLGQCEVGLMIELDRAGNDYVFYEYNNAEIEDIMDELGLVQGMGSFSDICMLTELGITGINIGVGYTKAHSKASVQSKLGMKYAFAVCVELINICRDEVYIDEPIRHKYSWKDSTW